MSPASPNKEHIFRFFPIILVLYEITNYLANDMYLPALPSIARELNTSDYLIQLTLTFWFFGSASMQLLLGPISDRFGRRPVLFGGAIVFIAATLICTFTNNIHILIVARFFQGCAVCSVVTAGYSSIHELYVHTKAIQILAVMSSITLLAPAFGPLAGSIVLQWLDWRWIFGILCIWSLIAIKALWFVMPESNPKETQHALIFKVLFKNYWEILCNPTFMFNTLLFCFTFLCMIAWIAAGPFLVIQTFHYNIIFFGIFQAMVFGCLILASQVVKFTVAKISAQRLINIGLYTATIGSSMAIFLTWVFPTFLLGLILSLMIFTFGANLAFSPSHRIAIEACSQPMGARVAVFSTMMGIFGVLGSLLVSLTFNGTLSWFGKLLIVIIILAWIARWLERMSRKSINC